jgi:hypothetical protein
MRVVVWGGSYQANFADDKKTTVCKQATNVEDSSRTIVILFFNYLMLASTK